MIIIKMDNWPEELIIGCPAQRASCAYLQIYEKIFSADKRSSFLLKECLWMKKKTALNIDTGGQCYKTFLSVILYKKIDANSLSFNGKEATVNRALDGSTYPS